MKTLLAKFGPFLGLLLVIGLFSLSGEIRDYFLSYANFKIILTQTVIVALGALGMTLIIISGGIDLSVGSVIAFCGVVGALLIQQNWPLVAVVLAVIAAGGLIGLLNGSAIAGLRMTPFIITLGTLGIARGGAKWLANNETVNYDTSPLNGWMTTADPFGWALPAGAWITAGLAILTAVLLRSTVFGRHIFAHRLERGDGAACAEWRRRG
jgi:ribose transport system permease protein